MLAWIVAGALAILLVALVIGVACLLLDARARL